MSIFKTALTKIKKFFSDPLSRNNAEKINDIKSFKMSFDNKAYTFKTGLRKDTIDTRDKVKAAVIKTDDQQDITITDTSLSTYAPPTSQFNQHSTSACGGFSGSALAYILLKKMQAKAGKGEDVKLLSPLFVYYNARKYDGNGSENEDAGTTLRSVMKALRNPGVIEDDAFKFSRHTPYDAPDEKALSASKFTINNYFSIPLGLGEYSINMVKDILAFEQLPILMGIILYNDQLTYARWNGEFRPTKDFGPSNLLGGHAICITGYKTDEKTGNVYLEFINSWGKDFGKNGYAYFPIDWINDNNYIMGAWCVDKATW